MSTKVFLSSTFKDLELHRKKVWKVLNSYDVEIKGMERFGARPTTPLATCLKEVRESQIYLGVIGMVYGSIDKKSGKSFTQLEYEEAVKKKLDILVYLFDEENGMIPAKFIDFRNYSQLKEFKTYLKKEHTIDTFKDADELADKINEKFKSIKFPLHKGFYREKRIKAKITRFQDREEWVMITGFQDDRPVEIYCRKAEEFFVPKWIHDGQIDKMEGEYRGKKGVRFDLHFEDKDGYKVIMQGVHRNFGGPSPLCEVITLLLMSNKESIESIMEIASKIEIAEISKKDEFLSVIKKAILNKDFENHD